MCNPIVLAASLAVGATAVNTVGQIQQSKAIAKQINAQSALQAEQIKDQAAAEIFDRSIQTFERIGQSRVSGAARGLNDASGVLTMANDAILFDYDFDNTRTLANADMAQEQRLFETRSALSRASRPTLLGAGLQIAGAGLQAAHGAGAFQPQG